MMKKIALASALVAATLAGAYAARGYWWIQELRMDADRMRDLDEAFEDMTDVYYFDEAEDLDSPDDGA
jgi:hypothetical protein